KTGLWRRFAMVPGEQISANTKCSSSQTAVVPLGEGLGVRWAHGGNEPQLLFVDRASHVLCQDAHRVSFIAVSATAVRPPKRSHLSRRLSLEDFIALREHEPRLFPAGP